MGKNDKSVLWSRKEEKCTQARRVSLTKARRGRETRSTLLILWSTPARGHSAQSPEPTKHTHMLLKEKGGDSLEHTLMPT